MKTPKPGKNLTRAQTRPSTPPSKAEKGTSRPSKTAKLQMPPMPQPVPQNTKRVKA